MYLKKIDMEVRPNQMNRFAGKMGDISISRHPLRKYIFVVQRDKDVDQYLDVRTSEYRRVLKQAIVKKNVDMEYVMESFEDLVDDELNTPWVITMTSDGLERNIQHEDLIVVDGRRYVVASVRPMNRDIDALVSCAVYPDRDKGMDDLACYGVVFRDGLEQISLEEAQGGFHCMDVIYGGVPVEYSFDNDNWGEFRVKNKVLVPQYASLLYLRDESERTVCFDLVTGEERVL